jgi:hypothetical protein
MQIGSGISIGPGITVNGPVASAGGGDYSTSGLQLFLDAGNASSYSGSGTTWTDLSGVGNHATLSNDMASNFVSSGSSSYFDMGLEQTSRYASVPHSSTLKPTTALTIEAFVYASWTSSYASFVWMAGSPFLGHNSGAPNYLYFAINNNSASPNSGFDFQAMAPTWFHIVGTYDSSNIRIYRNAVEGTSRAYTSAISYGGNYPLWINGTNNASPGSAPVQNSMRGKIGVVRVYDVALTAEQITANYNWGKARYGLS